ncbi:protein of unknown function [Lutibacter oricola]|uniref:3-keto-alpha-glucoside-1,2-lyase/3-keto-2-hydroxy-glucal hydratase domain-containing protein n=1 Tax=Lutibacter oricola TaxID=762486 RepID=A0A1H2SB11_9FLAO|nr:DUF1080 domain-containing protein [Lutibacter oricola]SDW28727.1 protein of unknown function [Lutibacter oricola]
MKNFTQQLLVIILCVTASLSVYSQKSLNIEGPSKKIASKKWQPLLDKNLSKWEIWTGVPDPSVKNLPASYVIPEDGKPVDAIGLNNEMNVFSVSLDKDGTPILNISGEVYAGLTSKKEYANYHLTMLFKWGEKKWAPRLEAKRDCGLLYHCYGEHGAFWNVWKSCLELQIQEGDMGDLYCLAGTKSKVSADKTNHWDPKGERISKTAKRSVDAESPNGKWTRIDLYVVDDVAIHVVNGHVVLALKDAITNKGEKLNKGQIQIQSEGAECYAKEIFIRPLKKFPKKIKKVAGF